MLKCVGFFHLQLSPVSLSATGFCIIRDNGLQLYIVFIIISKYFSILFSLIQQVNGVQG